MVIAVESKQPSLTVEDLEAAGLDDQFDAIESAVERHLGGDVANIAVIAEPFAGRDIFLDYAQEEFGAASQRVSIDQLVTDELPEFPNAEIVLVDNCHLLYQRKIGGFDMLEEFLDYIAGRESLYVTSWNRYAWSYLTAVSDVGRAFPERIQIPRLNASQIGDLLKSYHGTPLPMFEEGTTSGRVDTFDLGWRETDIWGRSIHVPAVTFKSEYFLSRFRTDADENVEAVLYQRIAKLSEGDPGVATILWDRSIQDNRIAPNDIQTVDKPLDLTLEESFVLEVILTNETITYDTLVETCEGIAIDRALQTLVGQGVVNIGDTKRIGLEPVRLYSVVEHLKRRQLVW
jgi:hypothetical protein